MEIVLSEKNCKCGEIISKRKIDIRIFRKEICEITETTLRIWNDKKCCWKCKTKPKAGEKWGVSFNNVERNRLFCPKCSSFIEKKMENKKNELSRI